MTLACEYIADGLTVKEAATKAGTTRKSLWLWAATDAALGDLYARARSISADAYDDEALEVARTSTPETVAADRLRVDQLKWAAAKRRPKEYGDRQQVEVSGTVGHLHMDALKAGKVSAKATLSIPDTPLLSSSSTPDDVSPKEDTDQ